MMHFSFTSFRVFVSHRLPRDEVKKRLSNLAHDLVTHFPQARWVSDPMQEDWDGYGCEFSFLFFWAEIGGAITVTDAQVSVTGRIPLRICFMKGKTKQAIRLELQRLLDPPLKRVVAAAPRAPMAAPIVPVVATISVEPKQDVVVESKSVVVETPKPVTVEESAVPTVAALPIELEPAAVVTPKSVVVETPKAETAEEPKQVAVEAPTMPTVAALPIEPKPIEVEASRPVAEVPKPMITEPPKPVVVEAPKPVIAAARVAQPKVEPELAPKAVFVPTKVPQVPVEAKPRAPARLRQRHLRAEPQASPPDLRAGIRDDIKRIIQEREDRLMEAIRNL